MRDRTDKQLTIRLKNTIISIDGDTDQNTINHFVDNELFAADKIKQNAYKQSYSRYGFNI